jgi:shikimate dehydrogenase
MAEPRRPYAEVIGDPIEHSLSPTIHNHWLERLGIPGVYRRQPCPAGTIAAYLDRRLADPLWRGCNLTMPLKEEAAAALQAEPRIGAVNCIARDGDRLVALNTDVDGIAAALGGVDLAGKHAVVIGAGGAARAALAELAGRGAHVTTLARSPVKAEPLRALHERLTIAPLAHAASAISGAAALVNASPLGMEGGSPMPPAIVDAIAGAAPGAIALDMVYRPLTTLFLKAAASAGLHTEDGLTMLIAQARRPFALFFGAPPPAGDAALRALLLREIRAG